MTVTPNPEIDAYMARFPEHAQARMKQMRAIIHKAAPKSEEIISYSMPGYRENGMLVYFAAAKEHLGFYPKGHAAIDAFATDLTGYKTSAGAIQFPYDKPLPAALITRIVKFRIKANHAKLKPVKK